MLGVVYWQGAMPPNIQIGLTTATLGGSMLGQLLFGFAADWLGRRRTYGWELIVTIVATIGVASASSGISGVIPPSVIYNANETYPSNGNYNTTGFYYDSATYTANGIDPWNGSLSIIGGLIAWRFVLGLAIGADYPLSAVICSE
jgi:PHS family inorganic phosphate transporter-like MFS transporter